MDRHGKQKRSVSAGAGELIAREAACRIVHVDLVGQVRSPAPEHEIDVREARRQHVTCWVRGGVQRSDKGERLVAAWQARGPQPARSAGDMHRVGLGFPRHIRQRRELGEWWWPDSSSPEDSGGMKCAAGVTRVEDDRTADTCVGERDDDRLVSERGKADEREIAPVEPVSEIVKRF